jgi:uroporphyrinogen decarboxylase
MNSKERILAAFEKRPTDRVPIYHLGFSSQVASALLGREAYVGGGIQQWREAVAWWQGEEAHATFEERSLQDAIDIAQFCEHDLVRPNYWRYRPRPTHRLDEYTFLYEDGPQENWRVLQFDPPSEQCSIYSYVPEAALTYTDLERQLERQEAALPDYQPSEALFANELEAQRRLPDHAIRVTAAGIGIGLEPIWLEATALRPDLVERKLDLQLEHAVRNAHFLVDHGLPLVFGGDDFASNDGPMYSPRVFHRFMLPRLQRLTAACHAVGAFFSFDSDGNLWPVADDLFGRSGIDSYHEVDRRAGMDLAKLRRRFPQLTLIGNINSTDVATLSPAEVAAQTRDCLEFAKTTTGVIVGMSNYFVPGTPMENVHAVLDTIRAYR